jgi:hypothetical protein
MPMLKSELSTSLELFAPREMLTQLSSPKTQLHPSTIPRSSILKSPQPSLFYAPSPVTSMSTVYLSTASGAPPSLKSILRLQIRLKRSRFQLRPQWPVISTPSSSKINNLKKNFLRRASSKRYKSFKQKNLSLEGFK